MKSDNNEDKSKFTIDNNVITNIVEFCKKNVKYISAGVLVVLLVIVLAVASSRQKVKEVQEQDITGEANQPEQDTDAAEEFAVDANAELTSLVSIYYEAYATGDMETIESCARPVSETEKDYIGLLSQYVTGYENIVCYIKNGLNEGEYAVSVSLDMRFDGIETMAPGLDFFYIRTDEESKLYIDNLYSQFNLRNEEQALDSAVEEFMASYEAEEDVIKLQESIENSYNEAVEADENLKTMVRTTIPQAIQEWVASLTDSKEPEEAVAETTEEAVPEETAEETTEEVVPEETADEATEPETVYATDNINIRKEPNESAEKAGSALKGDSFTRTGTTEDGWSIIDYHDAKAYIKSDFLSTEVVAADSSANTGLSYIPDGKTLTMNSAVNVRRSMSETSEKMGTTQVGDTIKVILSYQEGWTKVEWNGKTGYIKTEILLNN